MTDGISCLFISFFPVLKAPRIYANFIYLWNAKAKHPILHNQYRVFCYCNIGYFGGPKQGVFQPADNETIT